MSSILDKIVKQTSSDLKRRKRDVSVKDLESFEGFYKERYLLSENLKSESEVSIIAEVKKASPLKGVIRPDFDPLKIAESYYKNGASAISVLTDEPFFQGSLTYLEKIAKKIPIPLLRKDFIIDPYQISEAKAFGADAILIIVSITKGNQLQELLSAAKEASLEALVECYSPEDADRLDYDQFPILGVNNRDLHTFEVDLHKGIELLQAAPGHIVTVSESGISKPEDLVKLYENKIDAALIGEYFMRQPNPGEALASMLESFNKKMNLELK